MYPEYSLYDLLEVENHPSLLEFKCAETDILLWPMVRNYFFRFIIFDLMYGGQSVNQFPHRNYRVILPSIVKSVIHNFRHWHQNRSNIVIMTTGLGNVIQDGRWFNRLSDYFAMAARRETLTIEDLHEGRWPFPRHNPRVVFRTLMDLRGKIAGAILVSGKDESLSKKLIAMARYRAKNHLNWELGDKRSAILSRYLARQIAAIPIRRRAYKRILARTGARVVIKQLGCYGISGVFNATANDMGLVVAEYQHGMISAGHDAYNVAPILIQNRLYKRMLPQFFLGYGQWWNDQINMPVAKIAVGNPHRTEQLKRITGRKDIKSDILVLGDGYKTAVYLELARNLSTGISKPFRVVFRPHPMEREKLSALYSGNLLRDVHIDCNPDIYRSFCTAHAVVSEISTGLFEAVGLADRVFLWNTYRARFGYPTHPFASFSDSRDLIEKLHNNHEGYVDFRKEDHIWSPNWRDNYLAFLNDIGG
jgi:hypothetical protein